MNALRTYRASVPAAPFSRSDDRASPVQADNHPMTERRAETQEVRVLMVGAEPIIGRGVELLLTAHDVPVVGRATGALEAIEMLRTSRPTIAVLDLGLSDGAPACVQVLREAAPDLPVLAFGGRRPWPLQELLDAGLRGFVLTSSQPERFVAAIRAVASGQTHLDTGFAPAERGDAARRDRPALSPREREIMGLLALGLSGREVAVRLSLSPATVRTHVQNAMHKLNARTRAHAIAILSGGSPPSRPARELSLTG